MNGSWNTATRNIVVKIPVPPKRPFSTFIKSAKRIVKRTSGPSNFLGLPRPRPDFFEKKRYIAAVKSVIARICLKRSSLS